MNLGLTNASSYVLVPGYVFNNITLVGSIGDGCKLLGQNCNFIGRVAYN